MLDKILNLKSKTLNKTEQKSIKGGLQFPIGCISRADCIRITGELDWTCSRRRCVPL